MIIRSSILLLIIITCNACALKKKSYYLHGEGCRRVYTGLENFLNNYSDDYKRKKTAIVTNHSGVDYYLQKNVNLIRNKGLEITLILAPEHGLYGYQNEYDKNDYLIDDKLNAIIYNLHLLNSKTLFHLLRVSEIVIFDMQDMGMRCYTYVSSLKFIMDTLAGSDIELVVLDRPNPLGFLKIIGPGLDNNFFSKHISAFPAPFLYNMTIGEAALYYNGEFLDKLKIKVIPLKGYWRDMFYSDTKLPWIPPSPNLPTYMSAIVYAAVVLMEGINISLGRGTTKPFEYIGAPWIDPVSFCEGLNKLNLENFSFRPVFFKPTFAKYEQEKCGGAQIFYTGGRFNPLEISYKIIRYIMNNYSEFNWEIFQDKFNVDYLAGTDNFRKAISKNIDFEIFFKPIKDDLESYSDKRKKYLLYKEGIFNKI